MGVDIIQRDRVARYVIGQKIKGKPRYPLVLMLEPLFRCNLSCAGCGKISYPEKILNRRLSLNECLAASDECGAPIVAISGGEPLIHEEMPRIVTGLIQRKRFVYLCTNGLLLRTRIHDYTPSPYLTLSVHLDGDRERHDALACREGVYNSAVEAVRLAASKGFRITINCTLYDGVSASQVSDFFDFLMSLGIEGIMVSPAYQYSEAPKKEIFLKRTRSINLFREILKLGKGKHWNFNHSPLFLDFLAGNQPYACTPWGNPTRNIFGWQKPCYLLTKEGYAPSFKSLLDETDWARYGNGRNPKCANCMLHSGFEPTAVNDTLAHPLKAFYISFRGPRTDGPTPPESE